jgi:signal peptidase I
MRTPRFTTQTWTTHTQAARNWTAHAPEHITIRKVFSVLLLVLAFCALALSGYQVASGQWHATPVLSGSMRPGLQPGDVVVTQRVPISDLHVRDVVVFHPPNEGDRLTVHRIVKLTVKGGTTSITTWGDANPIADPVVSSLSGTTAYRVTRVVPLLGYPAIWLQNGSRGMLAVALGVILLIVAVVTLIRPDKRAEPPGAADPADPTREPLEVVPDKSSQSQSAALPASHN